jgi:hypothetical protein
MTQKEKKKSEVISWLEVQDVFFRGLEASKEKWIYFQVIR